MFLGYRLNNIRIGVTDYEPSLAPPTLDNIHVCACRNDPVPDGAFLSFPCWATGRYLVVLLQGVQSLTLCEVEVFEGKKVRIVIKNENTLNVITCI